MICEHVTELQKLYEKSFSSFYAPCIPLRCQDCRRFDVIPEINTWVSLLNLSSKKEKVYFCEEHIDLIEPQGIYMNLTDTCIWCRACEKRFLMDLSLCERVLGIVGLESSPGTRGLKNLGNTCFINSVIQSLSNCTALKYYLIESGNCEVFLKDNSSKL